MKVQVLKVTQTGKGYNVVHVQAGHHFGDCLAAEDVVEPGDYFLRSTLRVRNGRLEPLIRVEKLPS